MAEPAAHSRPSIGSPEPLDERSARTALVEACAVLGLDPAGAHLIRIGENGVFRLSTARVIARVARSSAQLHAVRRQLAVSRWLATQNVPAVRALDLDQPVVTSGRVVTFWESAADNIRYGTTRDLGEILHQLHELDPPLELELSALDPFAATRARIEQVTIDDDDRYYLRSVCDRLTGLYGQLSFSDPPVVLHGDANVGNLILDRADRPLLADLDSFSVGPAEWDLVLTGMFYKRYGWHTEQEYSDFVVAYGRDITAWSGFDVLADIRELLMVAWLAQHTHEPAARKELAKRLASMRTGTGRRTWAPF